MTGVWSAHLRLPILMPCSFFFAGGELIWQLSCSKADEFEFHLAKSFCFSSFVVTIDEICIRGDRSELAWDCTVLAWLLRYLTFPQEKSNFFIATLSWECQLADKRIEQQSTKIMGNLLSLLLKDDHCCPFAVTKYDIFMDFENAQPQVEVAELYSDLENLLAASSGVLETIRGYECEWVADYRFHVFMYFILRCFGTYKIGNHFSGSCQRIEGVGSSLAIGDKVKVLLRIFIRS